MYKPTFSDCRSPVFKIIRKVCPRPDNTCVNSSHLCKAGVAQLSRNERKHKFIYNYVRLSYSNVAKEFSKLYSSEKM